MSAQLVEPEPQPGLEQTWAAPLQAVNEAKRVARAAFNETLRDATRAGLNPTQIARQLGTPDRRRIYELNSKEPSEEEKAIGRKRPGLPHVVFLRGAKASPETWDRIQQAMWRRGWHTTMSRGDAWHLARGRVPVVYVDFSPRSTNDTKVGLVRAKYGDDGKTELPIVLGGSIPTPTCGDGGLDVDAIARAVQEVIGQSAARR